MRLTAAAGTTSAAAHPTALARRRCRQHCSVPRAPAPTSPLMVSLLANRGMVSTSSRLFFTVTVGCTPPLAAAAADGRSSSCTVQDAAPTSPPNNLFCGAGCGAVQAQV